MTRLRVPKLPRSLAAFPYFPRSKAGRSSFAVAVVVNLVLLAAYVWSRGGQTTTIRIEARGDDVIAYVDGREFGHIQAPGTSGGPVVRLTETSEIRLPARPQPRGVREVRVTSLENGEVLYSWHSGDPVLDGDSTAIDLSGKDWDDYAIDVMLANPITAGIAVRVTDGEGPLFGFNRFDRPLIFLQHTASGQEPQTIGTARLEFDRSEGTRALVAMVLRPYPYLLGFTVLFTVLAAAASYAFTRSGARVHALSISPAALYRVAGAIALLFFVSAATIFTRYGQRMPHVVDETSYIYQARLLASGKAHIATPPIPEAFQFGASPFIVDFDGRWASFYPFGQPAVLAIAEVFGVMWLVPPLLSAVGVFLVFLLGRWLYGAFAGLVSSVFMAVSPFVLMQASSYMSHTTAAACLLGSLAAWWLPSKTRAPWAAVSGLAYGLLFNTRPFTALLISPWFALVLLIDLRAPDQRRLNLYRTAAFAAGIALMAALYFGYNYATTGTLSSGYNTGNHAEPSIGFGGAHSVAAALEHQHALLATLIASLYGLPAVVGLALVLLPFVLGTRRLIDWWLLGASVTVMTGYMLYDYAGIFFGPRYWFEIVPFLFLLSGRGVSLLVARSADIASATNPGTRDQANVVATGIAAALVVVLAATSAYSWLFAGRTEWVYPTVPSAARDLRFAFDDRLKRAIETQNLKQALVLVQPCGDTRLCYQSVFLLNDIDLNGQLVVVNDLGSRNEELFDLYPCRDIYIATYDTASVVPRGRTPCP